MNVYAVRFLKSIKKEGDGQAIPTRYITNESYYVGPAEKVKQPLRKTVSSVHQAQQMTKECAESLVAKIGTTELGKPEAVEIPYDSERWRTATYAPPNTLAELGEDKDEKPAVVLNGLGQLKRAVEQCFTEGMSVLDVLAAANKLAVNG